MSEHYATVVWERGEGDFTDGKYSRVHVWRFDGGAEIPASPSPLIVPAPMSDECHVDPEEAFVASASSCHMLFFLEIAAKRRYVVSRYFDAAVGTMEKDEKGKEMISRIQLRPEVIFEDENIPNRKSLEKMHHQAHGLCFIANSIKTEITTEITEAQHKLRAPLLIVGEKD